MNSLTMRFSAIAFLLPLMWVWSGPAWSADTETESLRAENARLKAQIQRLQQSCGVTGAPTGAFAPPPVPSSGTPTAAAMPVPPPATVPVATAVAAPAAPAAPAPPVPVQAQAQAQVPTPVAAAVVTPNAAPPLPTPPPGYKLVPADTPDYVNPLAPPYDHTGCSRELFSGPPPAKWNNADNWLDIGRGLTMAEVEARLGKEHFDVAGQDRVEWQYGKCGSSVSGRVQFQKGEVVNWQVPSL